MKIFTLPRGILAILLLAVSCFLSFPMKAQTIQIDSLFTSDGEIFPFGPNDTIYGLSISGSVTLLSDTSLVRVILTDNAGHEWMVYEAYPLIVTYTAFNIEEECDETCFLDQLLPYSIIIQVIDASLDLESLSYSKYPKEDAIKQQFKSKRSKDAEKIEAINQHIPSYNMNWVAGDNSIVAIYYDQKRNMFGDGYNLRGYEYYAGGVFEFLGHRAYPKVDPDMVWNFDWRNRHGANDSLSPYWDGDTLGTGWLTPVKDQGNCGSCWAFSAIGTTEAIANLFTTLHLNLDLSEQQVLSCSDRNGNCDSGHRDSALFFIKNEGVVTENCCPYIAQSPSCSNLTICEEPDTIITIKDYHEFITDQDSIRIALIKDGPQSIGFNLSKSKAHATVLTGFEFDSIDSTINWIYKNSWGDIGPEHGFNTMKIDYLSANGIDNPVFLNDEPLIDTCRDEDKDGYFFWGIGKKPLDCTCSDIEDCDDNDSLVGGYDENYNCTCLLEYISMPKIITTDTIWEDTLSVNQTVIVDSGACLTIESLARFSSPAKIIVKQGGKLIIDGGKLTNACPNELWDGIEAYGSDTNQYFYQYFGVVNVINGGTIENATTAIANHCKTCDYINEESGGVIRTDNAVFRNNRVAVDFAPFENEWQGQEQPYRATFAKSLFKYDDYLNDYSDFEYFIKMHQVNGIKFYGCDFICDTNIIHTEKEVTYKYRSGIYSVGSQFYVGNTCVSQISPCTQYKQSLFQGLNYGIYALGINGRETITVKRSRFDKNKTGIYLSAVNYATIVQDTFNIRTIDYQKDTLSGLYLDNCTGYQVEDNIFLGNLNPFNPWQISVKSIGLVINNSGVMYNEIYNNAFDSLFVGVSAQDQNRDRSGDLGLQILCNDFTNSRFDISVTKSDELVRDMGIKVEQGNEGTEATSPANNTFSWVDKEFSDYYNNCENIIYWHLDASLTTAHVKPVDYSSTVNPQHDNGNSWVYDKEICCPSNLDTIGGGGGSIEDEKNKMMIAEQKADSILNILNILVDGGSTEELIAEIQNSSPEDALTLYSELIMNSPYLTDTSMVMAINQENVLSPSLITDILLENPQSAKSDTVQQALEMRSNPLSEEQRLEIDQGWFVISAKESLESRLSGANSIRNRALNNLIRYFKNDTLIASSVDSIIFLLSNENNLELKYSLVFEYLGKGDTISARGILDDIPVSFNLTSSQNQQLQNYENYVDLWISLISQNKTFLDSDSLHKVQIKALMNNSDGVLKMMLQNVLEVIDTINYHEPYILPESGQKSSEIRPIQIKQTVHSSYLRVYPNPTSNYCLIEYSLKIEGSDALIQIIDIHGCVIKQIEVYKDNDLLLVNLNDLPNGIYLFQLIEYGKKSGIQKMIKN
ncbi:MAG: T9SS type A sorting domain-containing protein [Bacteroidales bacterium]|nr:T9SS type A sorting domain-containing protein [Bacteroidales bacterium]